MERVIRKKKLDHPGNVSSFDYILVLGRHPEVAGAERNNASRKGILLIACSIRKTSKLFQGKNYCSKAETIAQKSPQTEHEIKLTSRNGHRFSRRKKKLI